MCSGGSRRSDPPPPVPVPQVLRNPFLDSFVPGSAGGILRSGRASLRIGLGSGRSGRTTETGAVGAVQSTNEISRGGSQGTGEFTDLTFGKVDRDRAFNQSAAEVKRRRDEARAKKRADMLARMDDRGGRR